MESNETQEQQQSQEIDEAALAAQTEEQGKPEGSPEESPAESSGVADAAPVAKVEEEAEEVKAKREDRRRTFQARVDNLTRKIYEAEEKAEFFKRRYEEVTKPIQREQFATDDEFEQARLDQKIGAQAIAVNGRLAVESKSEAAVEAYRERVAEFAQERPDWFEKVSKLVTTPVMEAEIVVSPQGAEISYYLAEHPGEAARIARLSPDAQRREIVRLESRDLFGTAEAKPTKSSAPAPIKPLATASKAPLSAEDEYQQWAEKRNAKNRYGA